MFCLRDADTNTSIWYGRHNSYRSGAAAALGSESAGQRLICIASNYSSAFDQVVINAQRGRVFVIAVAFSEAWHAVNTTDHIHVDNVVGLSTQYQPITKWSINTSLTAGGWYSVGGMSPLSAGSMTIRSDHNIVTIMMARVYNGTSLLKQMGTAYLSSYNAFTSIRIKGAGTWFHIVQIYINPTYMSTTRQFSALFDDTCPKDHGTAGTTISILPLDFIPDATSITSSNSNLDPPPGDVSGWSVLDTLSL